MSHEVGVQQMDLQVLAQRCAQETELYRKQEVHDTRYCFELFRRAIQGNDSDAWGPILETYNKTITGWIVRHYGFASSGMDVQDFIDDVIKRILSTITAEKFEKFSGLAALLGYLKLCVHSVIVDFMRATDYANLSAWEETSESVRMEDPSPEEQVMDGSERQKLWELLGTRLHDEKERLVIHGSFVLDLKPQEILDYFPGKFNGIDEIYRTKQNVFSRLRRDDEFRELLGVDD